MKTIQTKGWYDVIELERCVATIKNTIVESKTHAYPAAARYLSIVVDQISGNFAVRDAKNRDVEEEIIYSMFPALATTPEVVVVPPPPPAPEEVPAG